MSDTQTTKTPVGTIISADITVPHATELRDFYKAVVGWESEDMPLSDEHGEYADYVMKDNKGNWVGGVCHQRGANKDLPPQWIVYINVENIGASVDACLKLGGKVLKESKNEDGSLQYALLQDPVGAILAVTKAME